MTPQNIPALVSGNIWLRGWLDVPQHRLPAVMSALPEHVRLTHAEPGCRFFSVTPSLEITGRLLVEEVFCDQQAFDGHQKRLQASAWAEVTKGIERDYEIETIV